MLFDFGLLDGIFHQRKLSSVINKYYYIHADIVIDSVLSGEPVYSFELCSPNVCFVFYCQSEVNSKSIISVAVLIYCK